jgi:hypothetical protein
MPESLADFLGVRDPRKADDDKPKKITRKVISEFAREILSSEEYRASLLRRIFLDELPPAVELLLYHYAHGKPVEKVEVKDTTIAVENMTAEQCEERALFLVEYARRMREHENENALPDDDDEPMPTTPVH